MGSRPGKSGRPTGKVKWDRQRPVRYCLRWEVQLSRRRHHPLCRQNPQATPHQRPNSLPELFEWGTSHEVRCLENIRVTLWSDTYLSLRRKFNTSHVVKLLGVVSHGSPPLVLMEKMEHGSLRSYLLKLKKKKDHRLTEEVRKCISHPLP